VEKPDDDCNQSKLYRDPLSLRHLEQNTWETSRLYGCPRVPPVLYQGDLGIVYIS